MTLDSIAREALKAGMLESLFTGPPPAAAVEPLARDASIMELAITPLKTRVE